MVSMQMKGFANYMLLMDLEDAIAMEKNSI